jgi:predicted RNA-binding Zn ribbon-like protein
MGPVPREPAPVAFCNTRSSAGRDRIATLAEWRAWVDGWPGLRAVGRRVDSEGLIAMRRVRDDLQALLRAAAGGARHDTAAAARIGQLARSQPSYHIRWTAGRPTLTVPRSGDPTLVIAHQLARQTLDLLLTGPPVGVCEAEDCRKVFVLSRPDRRWCASTICGNRARVREHRRQTRSAATNAAAAESVAPNDPRERS